MKDSEPFIITVIQDLANITSLVNRHFNDEQKTQQWLNTENPQLKNQEPIEMIFKGQTEKLKNYIEKIWTIG